jgi:predicted nucleotidyltransferase
VRQCREREAVTTVDRERALNTLAAHRDEFRALGVRSPFLFGSLARGEATASDVDVLVDYEPDA